MAGGSGEGVGNESNNRTELIVCTWMVRKDVGNKTGDTGGVDQSFLTCGCGGCQPRSHREYPKGQVEWVATSKQTLWNDSKKV